MKNLFSHFFPVLSDSGGSRQDPGSGHEEALPPHYCPPVYQGGWAFSRSPGSVLSTHRSWANPLVLLSLRETETFGLLVDSPPSCTMKRLFIVWAGCTSNSSHNNEGHSGKLIIACYLKKRQKTQFSLHFTGVLALLFWFFFLFFCCFIFLNAQIIISFFFFFFLSPCFD